MSLLSPGVYVDESAFPTFNQVNPTSGGVFTFVGAHNRGPVNAPIFIQSWGQFLSVYGGFSGTTVPSTLSTAVYSFFANGGGACYVLRVVHTDAVIATQLIEDAAVPTPAATLDVAAANPGVWGNSIYIIVTPHTTTNTFDIAVYYGGTNANQLAEPVWSALSMNPGASNYAPSVINNPLNGSLFITVTDANATPSATSPLPAAATIQLGTSTGSVAGSDGSAVASADLVASQTLLNAITAPMVLNFPGVTDITNVLQSMATYCQTGRTFADSVLVVDPPSGQTPAAAITYAQQLSASSYALCYYPWVTVSDPASQAPGALRTLPPGAFAMAKMAVTDATRGVWKAPAGYATTLSALSLERQLQESDIANLTAAGVNAITYKKGAGIVIWGARTLSNQASTLYVNVRRLLIYVEYQLKLLSEYAVFEDNNYFLWTSINQRLGKFLGQMWASGAFAGSTQASSFFLTCDNTNNTPSSSVVNISVGIAASKPSEFIQISVGQWQGGTTVTESATSLPA